MFCYKPKTDLLAGKTILVTGATEDIGYAATIEYAKHGATIIILGRDKYKLENLYDEILGLNYAEPVIHNVDLATATAKDYEVMAQGIVENFGRLDGLLINSGYLPDLRPVGQIPDEQWLKSIQVNLHSSFFITKEMLPIMRSSKSASIIFTSADIVKGRAYWGAYAASIAASDALMATLADEELDISSVRVNCINPGAVHTKMRAKAYPIEDPLSLPTLAQIMPAYLYLMGDDSCNVSGEIIHAQKKRALEFAEYSS